MSDSEEDEYTSDESEAEEPSSTLILPRSEKGKEKEDISRQKREIQKRKSKHA